MAIDARNHTVPAGSGHPARADILSLALNIRDVIPVSNTTTRAAVITAMAAASVAVSASNPVIVARADARPDSMLEYTTDGTTWRSVPLSSGLVTGWTPTVVSGLTVGNGTWAGEYEQRGDWVEGWFMFTLGTTSSVTAAIVLACPLPIATTYPVLANIGAASLSSSSLGVTTGRIPGVLSVNSTTSPGNFQAFGGTGVVTTTHPFTWGTGDLYAGSFRYRAA